MKFRPLHDRVVICRIEGEAMTKGGILIPDTVKEKPQEGEVVAVGPGARDESGKLIALEVKAGDRVLFGKWSGSEVKIDGKDLLIMNESDILGVIEGAPDEESRLNDASPFQRRLPPFQRLERKPCPPKMYDFPPMPASACCAESKFSTTRSR